MNHGYKPQHNSTMSAGESINLDTVIDRYYVHYIKKGYDRVTIVDKILGHINRISCAFVGIKQVEDRLEKIGENQKKLERLRKLPKMEQRSEEWYKARNNMITASDFAQALGHGKFGTQKQFFEKKCGYEEDSFNANNPALKWGIMYEQVATDAYAMKNGMKVYEFGLLQHPSIPWAGASPDGITETGVMLEIKCPWKRKITGEVPEQYFYQMQGQLDVCDLDECDYLECEFLQYEDRTTFTAHFHDNPNPKGIILTREDGGYVYSPMDLCADLSGLDAWLEAQPMSTTSPPIYWQLHKYNVIRVYRDKDFINDKMKRLDAVWRQVVDMRGDKTKYDAYMAPPPAKPTKEEISIDTTFKASYVKRGQEVRFTSYAFIE